MISRLFKLGERFKLDLAGIEFWPYQRFLLSGVVVSPVAAQRALPGCRFIDVLVRHLKLKCLATMDTYSLAAYSSELLETSKDTELDLQQRLGLYQVFLKLYEHHRGLLDEILNLENTGSKSLLGAVLPYMQGTVVGQQVYLTTNVLQGKTQALCQPQNIWTIGRDNTQVLLPLLDKRLSRCHAAIRYSQQNFYLIDLDSSNGSYVNGERIRHSMRLKDGDRIRLGSLSFSFFVSYASRMLNPLSPEMLTRIAQADGLHQDMGAGQDFESSSSAEADDEARSNAMSPRMLQDTMHFMRPDDLQD